MQPRHKYPHGLFEHIMASEDRARAGEAPDLVEQGMRRGLQREAARKLRFLIGAAWFALVALLLLILWRVW